MCQDLELIGRMLPLLRWYQVVVTVTRFHQVLELCDLEMNQPRGGRIHSVWSLQAGSKPLEAVAERGSDI